MTRFLKVNYFFSSISFNCFLNNQNKISQINYAMNQIFKMVYDWSQETKSVWKNNNENFLVFETGKEVWENIIKSYQSLSKTSALRLETICCRYAEKKRKTEGLKEKSDSLAYRLRTIFRWRGSCIYSIYSIYLQFSVTLFFCFFALLNYSNLLHNLTPSNHISRLLENQFCAKNTYQNTTIKIWKEQLCQH